VIGRSCSTVYVDPIHAPRQTNARLKEPAGGASSRAIKLKQATQVRSDRAMTGAVRASLNSRNRETPRNTGAHQVALVSLLSPRGPRRTKRSSGALALELSRL